MKTIGFFNNKGGVGKTNLVYHVAWMLSELGYTVVTADFDPQANLTSAFLADERLEEIWNEPAAPTVAGALRPLIERAGDLLPPMVEPIGERIGLIVGDLALSQFEDSLSEVWPKCLAADIGAFRVTTAFYRLIQLAARETNADLALVDVGPNLGAINRAALLACDHIVIPLGADLYSLQGLRNVGPALQAWRRDWTDRRARKPERLPFELPDGRMAPSGYIVMRHAVRMDRPSQAFGKWMTRIPGQYAGSVLGEDTAAQSVESDPHCLSLLKDYRSLMLMAQEARKPMFLLKPADGAFGGHQQAVSGCYSDFRRLTKSILRTCAITPPGEPSATEVLRPDSVSLSDRS